MSPVHAFPALDETKQPDPQAEPRFPRHTRETAPAASKPLLDAVEQKYGFVPNLFGQLAESPVVLEAYPALYALFEKTDFSTEERQALMIAISAENDCQYCVAAHTTVAKATTRLNEHEIAGLQGGLPSGNSRIDALVRFGTQVTRQRGWMTDEQVDDFLSAGFTKAQVLEVVLAVSLKTISNYANHVTDTEVDPAFQANLARPHHPQNRFRVA